MRMHYYYIKVGDPIRIEKANGPRHACKLAFGVIYDAGQGLYVDIGTRSPKYFSDKKKQELKNGPWQTIPLTGA